MFPQVWQPQVTRADRDTEGNAAGCVGTCKAYHQLTNASQLQRTKGRFLKPVILRKDVHIIISQQMEASKATQWKADSLDELLTFDFIAQEPSCKHLLCETLFPHSYTYNASLLRGNVRCSVSDVLDISWLQGEVPTSRHWISADFPYGLSPDQDLPHKNGPGVSNEPKEHQQTYQDIEQEQAQVSQPPAANKNTVCKGKLVCKKHRSRSSCDFWGKQNPSLPQNHLQRLISRELWVFVGLEVEAGKRIYTICSAQAVVEKCHC